MSYRWGQDNGADIGKYSAQFGGADSFLFEGSEDILPHGMGQIIRILERGLTIELNKPVKEIDYSVPEKVQLTFGDGHRENFDRVILTAPLGVLKARDI